MTKSLSMLPLLLLMTAQSADAAAARPCFSHEDLSNLTLKMLPMVIDGAVDKCRPTLGASAYLTTAGPAFSQKVRADTADIDEQLRAAFERISGKPLSSGEAVDMTKTLNDEGVRRIVADIKPSACAAIGDLVRAMAPLPTHRLGDLLGALMTVATSGKADPKFPVCPPQS
ncbi:MAG TPA: hypothetical protein VFW19_11285 [Allosphingosinicella sp.]|nr:hypothetical protein [Allosphingosinicella sp.]